MTWHRRPTAFGISDKAYDQSQNLFCGVQRSQLLDPKRSEKQDARQKKFVEELELDKRIKKPEHQSPRLVRGGAPPSQQ